MTHAVVTSPTDNVELDVRDGGGRVGPRETSHRGRLANMPDAGSTHHMTNLVATFRTELESTRAEPHGMKKYNSIAFEKLEKEVGVT